MKALDDKTFERTLLIKKCDLDLNGGRKSISLYPISTMQKKKAEEIFGNVDEYSIAREHTYIYIENIYAGDVVVDRECVVVYGLEVRKNKNA